MWLYALTVFLSAFLLFQVQPLIGKFILPWFGGSPAVWTTCMLFFQTILLAGYAYAHGTNARLSPRAQAILHTVLLAAAVATLDLMRDEDLFARAGRMGQVLGDAVHGAIKGLPHVVGIRSLGLAAAVELESRPGLAGQRAYEVFLDCFKQGVLVRPAGENVVLAPAYVVEPAQIDPMVSTLAQALRKLA